MVKEVTYFMDEISGKAYKSYHTAIKKETESRLKLESLESVSYAEALALDYNFSSFKDLVDYLVANIGSIRNAGVRARIKALQNRGIHTFSLKDVKDSLKYLIDIAMNDIRGVKLKIVIYLDNLEVSSYYIEKNQFNESNIFFKEYNPTDNYLDNVIKTEDTYSYYYLSFPYRSYTEVTEEDTVAMLEEFNIQSCSSYMAILQSSVISDIEDEALYYALESAGVDNWVGFDYVRELVKADNKEWSDLSPEERIYYLDLGSVNYWDGYDIALDSLFDYDNLSVGEKYSFYIDNEDFLAKNWKDYTEFKKKLLL